MHTRPDGDLECFGIDKCTATDLKSTILHTASHSVLDLVALICLTSQMRGVMHFSPWFHTCTDFHVPEYRRSVSCTHDLRSPHDGSGATTRTPDQASGQFTVHLFLLILLQRFQYLS